MNLHDARKEAHAGNRVLYPNNPEEGLYSLIENKYWREERYARLEAEAEDDRSRREALGII
jgi:hypothetical protein